MSVAPEYQVLVQALDQLPGIGPQAAQRCARWLLQQPHNSLLEALQNARALQPCPRCRRYCRVQSSEPSCCEYNRNHPDLLVVQHDEDISCYRAKGYLGRFFVLHGLLSPMQGVGPKQLHLAQLTQVLQQEPPLRVGLCLPADVDAQTTAFYLRQLIQQSNLPTPPDVIDVDASSGALPWL